MYTTPNEYSTKYHIPADLIRKHCREGRLQHIKNGKMYIISEEITNQFFTDLMASSTTKKAANITDVDDMDKIIDLVAEGKI